MIITIDGPAGSGKTTIARGLARKLKISFLNTGAMYRAITLYLYRNSIPLDDIDKIKRALNKVKVSFEGERVFLCNEDVTEKITSAEVEKLVSEVSKIKIVRDKMVSLQREIAKGKSIVLEGRDTGSVVFPDANYKFYLYASIEERAKRRQKDIYERSKQNIPLDEVKNEIERRDLLDSSREISPLKVPEGAISIDTTNLGIEEVIDKILSYIR